MGTLTPNLMLSLPTIGGDAGPLFAQEINGDLSIIDSVYGGQNVLNVGGSANVTLTETQAQNLIQKFTGTLTGNITVLAPAVGAFYAVENATTGGFSLFFGCTGGANAQIIPQGLSTWLWTDGSATRLSNPPGWQEISTYNASSASALTIALPGPFRRFRLSIDTLVSTTGANLNMLFSTDGGATFAVSGYSTIAMVYSGSAPVVGTSLAAPAALLTMPLIASDNYDATLEIYPGSAFIGVNWRSNGIGAWSVPVQLAGENRVGNLANTSLINAMQISASSGTFSGVYILEGLP